VEQVLFVQSDVIGAGPPGDKAGEQRVAQSHGVERGHGVFAVAAFAFYLYEFLTISFAVFKIAVDLVLVSAESTVDISSPDPAPPRVEELVGSEVFTVGVGANLVSQKIENPVSGVSGGGIGDAEGRAIEMHDLLTQTFVVSHL